MTVGKCHRFDSLRVDCAITGDTDYVDAAVLTPQRPARITHLQPPPPSFQAPSTLEQTRDLAGPRRRMEPRSLRLLLEEFTTHVSATKSNYPGDTDASADVAPLAPARVARFPWRDQTIGGDRCRAHPRIRPKGGVRTEACDRPVMAERSTTPNERRRRVGGEAPVPAFRPVVSSPPPLRTRYVEFNVTGCMSGRWLC